jgi:hypothetical protein
MLRWCFTIRSLWRHSPKRGALALERYCDHPPALAVDPTENELRDLESMLAACPTCGQWTPGDGPIVAILPSRTKDRDDDFN